MQILSWLLLKTDHWLNGRWQKHRLREQKQPCWNEVSLSEFVWQYLSENFCEIKGTYGIPSRFRIPSCACVINPVVIFCYLTPLLNTLGTHQGDALRIYLYSLLYGSDYHLDLLYLPASPGKLSDFRVSLIPARYSQQVDSQLCGIGEDLRTWTLRTYQDPSQKGVDSNNDFEFPNRCISFLGCTACTSVIFRILTKINIHDFFVEPWVGDDTRQTSISHLSHCVQVPDSPWTAPMY